MTRSPCVCPGGLAGVVIACTDGTGNVKGCIDHPWWSCPQSQTYLDVGGAVGLKTIIAHRHPG